MRRSINKDPFSTEAEADLFGAATPSYRPDKGRARLHRILAETRSRTSPWELGRASLYRIIFPQLTLWLPEEEAAQLGLEFENEMERLQLT